MAEINDVLNRLATQGQEWRAQWVAHEICARHEGGIVDGDDGDFWRGNGYMAVRELVTRAINKRAGDKQDLPKSLQMSMFGWEHLQDYYIVTRDGEDIGIPVTSLTAAELRGKAETYRKMGAACFAHADELDRFSAVRRTDQAA